MVRAFGITEFAISKFSYHYPSVQPKYRHIVLISHILCSNLPTTPKHGIIFGDISILFAKLDNSVRREGST